MLSRRAFGIGLVGAGIVGVLGLPALGGRSASVTVVGFGGAGRNVLDAMLHAGITGVEYIAVDTDGDVLNGPARGLHVAPVLLAPSVGKRMMDFGCARPAEHPDRGRVAAALARADRVVLVGSLSTGSGSGAAVLVADVARKLGAVVVAIATHQGGHRRGRQTAHAVRGLSALGVPIIGWPHDRLLTVFGAPPVFTGPDRTHEAELLANYEIGRTVRAVAALAPVALEQMGAAFVIRPGMAVAGTASASFAEFGDEAGRAAAERAICTPLVNLEAMLASAPWVVVNVTGPTRFESAAAGALAEVQRAAPRRAKFVVGYVPDDALGDEVRVTVIAGGASRASERWWWGRRSRENPSPVLS